MNKSTTNKDVLRVVRRAVKAGWIVEHGGKHHHLVSPDGKRKISIPTTPSCPHAHKNLDKEIRTYEEAFCK